MESMVAKRAMVELKQVPLNKMNYEYSSNPPQYFSNICVMTLSVCDPESGRGGIASIDDDT